MTDGSFTMPASGLAAPLDGEWVDGTLLAGADNDVCLHLGRPVDRGELRRLVAEQQTLLTRAGLRAGGTVTLVLPPSLAYVASLLAAWRAGAQVSLLDHRLAPAEIERAIDRLAPQVVVTAAQVAAVPMSGYAEAVTAVAAREGGRPAETSHCLIQLSSGSTGPSKVIARTSADLVAELARYRSFGEYPQEGERIVLLASIVHVLGLVGGLLHSLHAGVRLTFPDRVTADGIRAAVSARAEPTMILGVPFHAELLNTAGGAGRLTQLSRMVVAGELTRPGVPEKFTGAYGVPLGSMYGMTELGVIATDLSGEHRPSVAPAPGMTPRIENGELLIAMGASPYIGLIDPTRWSDGWLHTRDAARIDPETGLVTILGRLDSQVAIGGLKVDLTEVEQTLCEVRGVTSAVVVFDGTIQAYVVLAEGCTTDSVAATLSEQLAAYKRPRVLHQLPDMPRTATGKVMRDRAVLRAHAGVSPAAPS